MACISILMLRFCTRNLSFYKNSPVLYISVNSQSRNEVCRNFAAHAKKIERKFSKKHSWVLAKGKLGTVGLTDFAQHHMGDLVYVLLPKVGTKCNMEEPCGILESLKAVHEFCSPVSGTISEKNTIEDNPTLINESCYDKGWLFKVELSRPGELNMLLDEDEYNEFVKEESEK